MYLISIGEDPLVDDQADHDINSVAGVLKLHFRGLENPLFPKERFLDLISTTSESHSRKRTCNINIKALACPVRVSHL